MHNLNKKFILVFNMNKRNIFDQNLYEYDAGGLVVMNLNENH